MLKMAGSTVGGGVAAAGGVGVGPRVGLDLGPAVFFAQPEESLKLNMGGCQS